MMMTMVRIRNASFNTTTKAKATRSIFLVVSLLIATSVVLLSTSKITVFVLSASITTASSISVECEVDGTCITGSGDSGGTTTSSSNPESNHHSLATESSAMECGLYLAESSIPHAGYGVYTGQNLSKHLPLTAYNDVVIQYADIMMQQKLQKEIYHLTIPKLLLREYFWKSSETYSTFDAYQIDSIVPGFGMLANCALGLVNHEQTGCQSRGVFDGVVYMGGATNRTSMTTIASRQDPSTGASSEYQDCYFTTSKEIPIGHEMFDNYGDDWFISRKSTFGSNVPLTDDYVRANRIVRMWQQLQNQSVVSWSRNTNMTLDFYDMIIMKGIKHHLPASTQRALPTMGQYAQQINYTARHTNNTVAYYGLTNDTAIRSIEWLNSNGMCLDHIVVQPLSNRSRHPLPNERGAFARRFIPKGQMVAPAPMVHLSRRHTDMIYADLVGGIPKTVLWQGHQLLLNYCYGHPKSSLLLFPYSHGVNLINHPTSTQKANVGLRWSKRMKHPEWLQYNVSQLLEELNDHSGLMMEFYALSDIPMGDEILYNYGTAWQQAWEKHVELWQRTINDTEAAVVHLENYISAYEYEQQCNYNISQSKQSNENSYLNRVPDCFMNAPSWIAVRCWVADYDKLTTAGSNHDDDEWLNWMAPDDAEYNKTTQEIYYYGMIDETYPCEVLSYSSSSSSSSTTSMDHFRVRLQYEERSPIEDGWHITNVPRSAIIMVDRPYTGNQFLRQAFRHEIQLPDEMVPESWEDLQPNQDVRCGLYMAESAIPFSGLGMYTGIDIPKGQKMFSGDVVVQVEDIDLNTKLRHWAAKDYDFEEKEWLLGNYYWNPETSLGIYEATSVESIIPGFGMLANSHTGLVNANIRTPTRYFDFSRGHDPGTGASTTFHNVYFDAKTDIEAGAELFVQYGDAWFQDREDLGFIPLSTDFKVADRTVRFLQLATENLTNTLKNEPQDFVVDFLDLVRRMVAAQPRLANAYPKDYNSFKIATEAGTATLTVPNRVRTIEWLEENGRCLDNIRPDLSTIRQAGRGAFATRNMKKGAVITPMPLVHILRRHMEIYHGDDYENKDGSFWIDGKQLLLNYCYGHPESSILLFPYAPVSNYINHNASYSNAELRWSTLPNHHADWLKRSPDDLDSETHSGLIMELVATRDIAFDEEIFLNYGSRWESSWNEFVKNQKLDSFDRHFTSSEALNNRLEWLKTVDEQEKDPYKFSNNDDIRTICFIFKNEKNLLVNATMKSMKTYRWSGTERLIHSDFSYPCDVVDRNLKIYGLDEAYDRQDSVFPAPVTYTVILIGEAIKIVDVPRKAIQFFDDEYMSDNTWRKAFRHEIHLPDHMVPRMWRDLNVSLRNSNTIS